MERASRRRHPTSHGSTGARAADAGLRASISTRAADCDDGVAMAQKPASGDEAALIALEEKWDAANVKGDVATLAAIFADTFNSTSSEGKVRTKAQMLAQLKSGEIKFQTSKV